MGYRGSRWSLYEYVSSAPSIGTDPGGLTGPGCCGAGRIYYGPLPSRRHDGPTLPNWYRWHMGCWSPWSQYNVDTWGRLRRGCVGVVEAYLRVDHPWTDASTKCFYVAGDASAAFELARDYAVDLCCPNGRRPMIWAVNFWGPSNGDVWGGCDEATGECHLSGMPTVPDPNSPGCIAFDYAIYNPPGIGFRDCWLGATTGWGVGRGNIVYWRDINAFSSGYRNYDTTVVCVTCPK